MKNIYIALTVQENNKNYAYVLKTNESNNIYSQLTGIKGLVTANVFSKQKAFEVVEFWNESFKNNGTYLYDETFLGE